MSISAMRQALQKISLFGLVLTYSTAHASTEDLVNIATSDAPVEIIKNKAETLALTAANQEIDSLENTALDHGWKHLDLSLGWENDKPTLTIMSVYGINETNNWFIFNQSSLVNYDHRNTLNLGIGARHITDNETVILGTNAFYDYELESGHRRASIGVEALTSMLEARANHYSARSGVRTYKGINESALDGYDYSLKVILPYTYSSNLYVKRSKWLDSINYSSSIHEWGLEIAPIENLTMQLGSRSTDNAASKLAATITYRMPFGHTKDSATEQPNGNWSNSLKSVREKMYQPVQRENKIAKKALKLGLTVSGY